MDLELLKCQNRFWVPILSGTLLHSSVDPYKEARQLIEQNWEYLSPVHTVIVLGLGGGFHVEELLNRGKEVVVVEEVRDLVRALEEKRMEFLNRVEIVAGVPPTQLYLEPSISKALSSSFAMLKHPPSVRVCSFYYNSVLSVLTDRAVVRLRELSRGNSKLDEFFHSLRVPGERVFTLPILEEALVERGAGIEEEGLVWMALRELVV